MISASGALAPGPLTTATAVMGVKRGWKTGFLVAMGHMMVELPLVVLIGLGVVTVMEERITPMALSMAGGLFLMFFGLLTLRDAVKFKWMAREVRRELYENPVLIGIALSALNPFFMIWWFGVGSPLIYKAISLWGLYGLSLMYVSHVWLDFAWLPLIAYLTSLGRLNLKVLRAILFTLALVVLYFGVWFIVNAISP
ncbi:MAG: LysE family translocator [Candidatus Nezhaarchaeota archaeon]|nr:LysE family translocator [Candidatus Nezhaarchaeota archaeon]MCX8141160.1 LysE family translocator [Candidatus Nezhaarchaeota archaeon]